MLLNQNIILLDTSCYVFSCYTGLVSWYKNELNIIFDHTNIMENTEFIKKYTSMFKNMLNKFKRKLNVPNCNIIMAKDCSRSDIWRKDIFPEYKKNRDERTSQKFNSCIFKYTYSHIIEHLRKDCGYVVLDLERAEADDIIALSVNTIHNISPETNVYIISNDKDYIQLVNNNTHVIDMKCIPLNNKITNNPKDYLLSKIIMGDKSDNIPPITTRIGKKKVANLIQNPSELTNLLKNDQIRQQYELNSKLIDFSNIPNKIRYNLQVKLDDALKRKMKKYEIGFCKTYKCTERW